eukprot:ANDGO_05457.mRNA.1 U2 small nuclear ribonucleoprotein B''
MESSTTVYVKNLSDRVPLRTLRELLYMLFSHSGRILDIVTKKSEKMKGQAFVVYSAHAEAAHAVSHLNGLSFLSEQIVVEFAKTNSDAFAKARGDYDHAGKAHRLMPR